MIDAWVQVDQEDLVVRTIWTERESYRPTRIEWTTPNSFTVREGKTCFDPFFQTRDDATRFASKMITSNPEIVESALPSSSELR